MKTCATGLIIRFFRRTTPTGQGAIDLPDVPTVRRPSELVNQIARLGFRDVFHLTPELAQERYFIGRQDNLRAPYWEQLIAALV